jgi:hypothetical protein
MYLQNSSTFGITLLKHPSMYFGTVQLKMQVLLLSQIENLKLNICTHTKNEKLYMNYKSITVIKQESDITDQ